MKTTYSFLIFYTLSIHLIFAQDNHYWSQQYGAKQTLLSGAVVGSVKDNTAAYYNPARIGLIENSTLSINADIYRLSLLTIKDVVGQGLDLTSRRMSIFPQLISGLIHIKKQPKVKLAYLVFTKSQDNERIDKRHEAFVDVFPIIKGDEYFSGIFEYENRVNEQWGALGVGYKINAVWSIGLTQFIAYRNHRNRLIFDTRTTKNKTSSDKVASTNMYHDLRIDAVRAIWKAGVSINKPKWSLGLTLTTPSVHIFGRGKMTREIAQYNIPTDSTGKKRQDILATGRQEQLKSRYKSPFSLAIGLARHIRKAQIMMTMEYFHQINLYQVLVGRDEPYTKTRTFRQNIANQIFNSVDYKSRWIINVAIGYEQVLSPKIKLLMGFRTDFKNINEIIQTDAVQLSPIQYNLYHATTGLEISFKRSKITTGIDYGFSVGDRLRPFVDFNNPNSIYTNSINRHSIKSSTYWYHGINVVVGYTYLFKRR